MKKQSPVKEVRNVKHFTKLLLFVRAGGRCEFDGHKKYLLEHPLTLTEMNLAEMAHIVAFKKDGPRGDTDPRPVDINNIDNLMLLCHDCHKLIDEAPDKYTVATLKAYKKNHEEQMYYVTSLSTRLRTTVLQFTGKINGQTVDIPVSHVLEAVAPRYPTNSQGFVIDVTGIEGHDAAYCQACMQTIRTKLELLYAPGMDVERTRHISLFAIANIPLLAYLGSQLSNKIPVDFYQRHRDSKNWVWKTEGPPAAYEFKLIRRGTDKKSVALLVSLTGRVHIEHLPVEIDERYYIYEITLQSQVPNPDFLKQREDLENFASIYRLALATIMGEHGKLDALNLFPAVPAPVAVVCGYELLPKVYPTFIVHDYDKSEGGFKYSIRINEP